MVWRQFSIVPCSKIILNAAVTFVEHTASNADKLQNLPLKNGFETKHMLLVISVKKTGLPYILWWLLWHPRDWICPKKFPRNLDTLLRSARPQLGEHKLDLFDESKAMYWMDTLLLPTKMAHPFAVTISLVFAVTWKQSLGSSEWSEQTNTTFFGNFSEML